jgi:antitoxin component YwqK of YwqJK toxin-antitoxin module
MYLVDYKNGLRNGELIEYESGVKIKEASYVNGQRCYFARWNMNGIKINEEKLDKDGTGQRIYWDNNGKKRMECDYFESMKHGKEIWYFENGNKEKESSFINGLEIGKPTEWD